MEPTLIAQILPPTPTAWPTPAATAQIVVNSRAWRIWAFADDAVMTWNEMGRTPTQVIQVAIILCIVIGFAMLARKWIQSLTNKGDL